MTTWDSVPQEQHGYIIESSKKKLLKLPGASEEMQGT